MITLVDLDSEYKSIKREIDSAVERVFQSSTFVLGEEVRAFEEEFATYIGARFCIGVANGTEALKLALESLGIGPGDRVIVPSNSFVATALAVSHVGAAPQFVDSDRNGLIDLNEVTKVIDETVKAILPVHLYGQVVNISALEQSGLPTV